MRHTASTNLARSIDRAFRGDRVAIEDLVRAETPRLHGIAWRILGDASLAEDVVQEVFVRILEKRSPVRRKGSAGVWLARVTAHAAIDLLRRRSARERREEAHAMAGAGSERKASDAVAEAEVRALVAEGFGALPVDVRAVIWLTVVEGDSLRRAAAAVGLPVTTVHRRVQEGLETLKKFLARRGATAALALPMADVLRRMPAPPAPGGLVARVLARIQVSTAIGGASGSAATASCILEKGVIGMASISVKKVWIGAALLLFLLLGGAVLMSDTFFLRKERRAEPVVSSAPHGADGAASPSPVAQPKEPTKPEAPPVDPFGSILARIVYEDDDAPVSGVLARAFGRAGGDLRTVTTDENGEARFARVPEGGFQVALQRGSTTFPAKKVEVKAGRESEVTFELPPGVGIDGTVVDGDGQPLPGASVWLTESYNTFQGAAVAVAGEDGKFRLRHVERNCFIGARAPGFAPSVLRSADGPPARVLTIRIVLEGAGVAVEGVVAGPDGNPLPGAMVKVVKESRGLMWTPDSIELRHAPLSVRTDGQGRFSFDGVPVGDLKISARSEGLVPFEEPIAVPEDGLSDLRIDLEEGATVFGTVRTPEGNFAGGTIIAIGPGESTDPYRSGDLASVATTAAADGTYRLVGVRRGEFEVRADSRGKGKASARLSAQEGEEVRWDAQLTLGLEILGRVVDENGQPVEKVLVGAEGSRCNHTWIWTDRTGRFRFSNCNGVPHTVSARLGDSQARVAQEEGVMPGSGEVTLVIHPAVSPSSFITGKVLDPDGKPAETAHLAMLGLSRIYAEKDGSFRIGPLPPGRHQFDVVLGEHPRIRRTCETAANQVVDLGVIRVYRGGRVQAYLRKPDGTPCPCSVRIMNEAADLDVETRCSPEGIVSSGLAQPGEYFVLIGQRGLAATCLPVRIEEGQTATADLTIREGVERVFRLFSPEKPSEPARVTVRTADGPRVFDCPLWADGWTPSPDASGFTRDVQVSFAPGLSYAAEAVLRDRRASASFAVSDTTEAAEPIVLELR